MRVSHISILKCGTFAQKREPLLGQTKPSGLALSSGPKKKGALAPEVCFLSTDNPPQPEHIRHHNQTNRLQLYFFERPSNRPCSCLFNSNKGPQSRLVVMPTHAHPHHTCRRPIHSKMHSIHQRWLLLRSPPTISRRNLAQSLPRARIRDADDFNNQLSYIESNPARKQYEAYPHVHSRYPDRITHTELSNTELSK